MSAGTGVLALFDVDGTLIRAGDPANRKTFDHALNEVYVVPATLDGIALAGMLEQRSTARRAARRGLHAGRGRRGAGGDHR